MELPVIDMPVLTRWVWMEEITYSHIPIATLITAFMVLAPIYEWIGYRKNDIRWDRLGQGLIWFAMILFSPGAALGTGIPVFIIGAYPEFWSRWSNLFFWPLVYQFGFFLMEVFFLFFFYYLNWDSWRGRLKKWHIVCGFIAMTWGVLVQVVWDALGAYMMTPGGVALPDVEQPVGWSAAAFFNPSFPLLFSHRFVGNISYTMLLVGGVFALRYMGTKNKENKAYLGWAADVTFAIGLLAYFFMPPIGWLYAEVIEHNAPVAFSAIMGGHAGPHFTVKMALIAVFLTLASVYLFVRHRGKVLHGAVTLGIISLSWIIIVHPPLQWFGPDPLIWRAACFAALAALIAACWLIRGRSNPEKKRWQWVMFAAGLAAFFAFALGGFVRERSKSPDTVYGEIIKPEANQMEMDRYLVYATCTRCHGGDEPMPDDFKRYAPKDWAARVPLELQRPGAPALSEPDVQRIVRFLEEHYP